MSYLFDDWALYGIEDATSKIYTLWDCDIFSCKTSLSLDGEVLIMCSVVGGKGALSCSVAYGWCVGQFEYSGLGLIVRTPSRRKHEKLVLKHFSSVWFHVSFQLSFCLISFSAQEVPHAF